MNMALTQYGLLLDIVGFVALFFVGGFNLGGGEYVASEPINANKIIRRLGFALIVAGFVLQLLATF